MKKIFTFAFLLFALTSCGTSKPTKFYRLEASPDTKIIDTRKIAVGIETVDIAGYLDRPQIVTIKDNTEISMSEYNRWAEPLSYSIQRVLAENISNHLKNGMAKPVPAKRQSYDYILLVELNKFDGRFGSKAELDVWWTITDENGKLLAREHSYYEAPLGRDYNDLVVKENELLSRLSQDIVKKISTIK